MVSKEQAAKFGVEWMTLEEIYPIADYITLHVPLIPPTENMINTNTLAKCKKGVFLINCARGGIINEPDLVAAMDAGQCGGAAFDVFAEEPPTNRALVDHPKVICAPHLGASTQEAQHRVAEEIADNIVQLNQGKALLGALNARCMSGLLNETSIGWANAARDAAKIARAAIDGQITGVTVTYPKAQECLEESFKASTLVGLLQKSTQNGLNLVNAAFHAKAAGITKVYLIADDKTSSIGVSITTALAAKTIAMRPSPGGSLLVYFDRIKLLAGGFLCPPDTTVSVCMKSDCSTELDDPLKSRILVRTGAVSPLSVFCFSRLTRELAANLPSRCAVVDF